MVAIQNDTAKKHKLTEKNRLSRKRKRVLEEVIKKLPSKFRKPKTAENDFDIRRIVDENGFFEGYEATE